MIEDFNFNEARTSTRSLDIPNPDDRKDLYYPTPPKTLAEDISRTQVWLLTAPYLNPYLPTRAAVSVEGIVAEGVALYRSPELASVIYHPIPTHTSLTPIQMNVPTGFYESLCSFYERFFALKSDLNTFYNCHRFAFWLQGATHLMEFIDREKELFEITKGGKLVDGDLDFMQHGVVGYSKIGVDRTKPPIPVHSVTGLGDAVVEPGRLIHVGGTRGPLLVTDHGNALVPYRRSSIYVA
ncbi:MAG: hypothetical protein QG623_64 [Patescibacteria group bacterium]|nr:hypothetical protein [Patescibacteria group bacterium]